MASIGLFSTVEQYDLKILDKLLPDNYGVVAIFPEKNRCDLKVAVKASRDEMDDVDTYFWKMSTIGINNQTSLLKSLRNNHLPAELVGDIPKEIDHHRRLQKEAEKRGKQYRSTDLSDSSGAGCLAGVASAIVTFFILAQIEIDSGLWSLAVIVLSILTGILVSLPFGHAHRLEEKERSKRRETVASMGLRLLDIDQRLSKLALRLKDSAEDLGRIEQMGLEGDSSRSTISEKLKLLMDTIYNEKLQLEKVARCDEILRDVNLDDIRSDEDLGIVKNECDNAWENAVKYAETRDSIEMEILGLTAALERERRVGETKLRAVRHRYENGTIAD